MFICFFLKITQITSIVKNFLINCDISNNMLIVQVKKDGIEKALKTLKSKVIKTKQNQILFEKKEFVKKSVVRRAQILKASYVQKVKNSLN
jgi:small subunit ribosomal protein S21